MRNHSLWVPGEYCRAAETYRNSRKGALVASCILRQNMAIYILHSMLAVDMAMATQQEQQQKLQQQHEQQHQPTTPTTTVSATTTTTFSTNTNSENMAYRSF